MKPSIRVLIADDSPTCRELMVAIVQEAGGLQVAGTARNGAEAVRLTHRLQPDIVMMDIHMPELDGFGAVRQIMAEAPRPIIMLTSSLRRDEQTKSFNALEAGALTILEKPTITDPAEQYESLVAHIKTLAEVKVVRRWAKPGDRPVRITPPAAQPAPSSAIRMVAIATSTGGPSALATLLGDLPADFPAPILVVQHLTSGFGEGLVAWLNQKTALEVRLARHADAPQPGKVYVAPEEYHLTVNRQGLLALDKEPPYHGLRPSANPLFHSVAQVYGATALGVILTGMGNDGAAGLRAMRQAGARTIAQDQASCVVFGMPGAAIELEAAEQVQPLNRIARALLELVGR
jgi:two-component system chemotaxis response regulator CheB